MDVEAHMETIWFERQRFEEAEARYQLHLSGGSQGEQVRCPPDVSFWAMGDSWQRLPCFLIIVSLEN